MTIVDASVLVDALVSAGEAGHSARTVLRHQPSLQVPSVFKAECTSALRTMLLRREVSRSRAQAAVEHVRAVHTLEYPLEPFLDRVWELRDNLTVYDAWYVALAERFRVPLVTADRRLVGSPGPDCPVLHVTDHAVGA